jgi:hypothetical protein
VRNLWRTAQGTDIFVFVVVLSDVRKNGGKVVVPQYRWKQCVQLSDVWQECVQFVGEYGGESGCSQCRHHLGEVIRYRTEPQS